MVCSLAPNMSSIGRMAQKHNTVSTTDMARRNTQGTAEDALGFWHCRRAPWRWEASGAPAHAREEGEGRDDQDDGEGDAEPGQRQWANLRYPADENAVDNVVEEVDDLCKNARDGET